MGGVPSGGSTWKNVIIGVLTTVAAYVIVHFLFINKEKNKEKAATIEAWNSMIRYEELFSENYIGAYCIEDKEEQLEALIYEKDQLVKNYTLISEKDNIDNDLASFTTRAAGNASAEKKILERYLADYKQVNPYEPLAEKEYERIDSLYASKMELIRIRDTSSFNSIFRNLSKKYGNKFKGASEPRAFTKSDLIGQWKEAGVNKIFHLKNETDFVMLLDGTEFSGRWKLNGKTARLTFDDGSGSVELHITRFNPAYIYFTIDDQETERICCRK